MKHLSIRSAITVTTLVASLAIALPTFAATTNTVVATTPTTKAELLSHFDTHTALSNHKARSAAKKGLGGIVTAISGTTITVSSGGKKPETYSIDASNAHFIGGTAKTASDVKIGDDVVAIGTITGTSVSATLIIDRPASEGTPKAFHAHRKATSDSASK